MKALTVEESPDRIVLTCPTCGPVASWPSGVQLADIGAAEQEHALAHALAEAGAR